jgi:phenylpropionate dioxygenase-like ring-hydroxylating dioxygenase large terminal subunit
MPNFLHPELDVVGWYVVARSRQIKRCQAASFSMLHRNIVVWRGEDGLVRVADAVCPHLGANLGHGKVVGNNLQCAFHGWRYAADGHCVSAPGQDRPPLRQLRQYAAQEKWGLVWLFNGDQPLWDLPEPDADLFPLVMPDAKVPTHPHLMIMNGLDGAHFEPLHHMHATSPPQYSTPDSYRVSLDLQGQWTSPVLGRLTGTQSKAIEVQFTTLGGNMAWMTVAAPVRCQVMFTGQPCAEGCRSRMIFFLPRAPRALRALAAMYLLLIDDRKILADLEFSPNFSPADIGLKAFVDVVNRLPVR